MNDNLLSEFSRLIFLLQEKIKMIELHLVHLKNDVYELQEKVMDKEEEKLNLILSKIPFKYRYK